MSQQDQDNRHARALLYAIAVLQLLCFGLVHEPTPKFGASQYAGRAVSTASSLHRS
jgi:hypothetical protein